MKKDHMFLLVLALLSFVLLTAPMLTHSEPYNPDGKTISTRFRLYGPDPYYNMRMCRVISETGETEFIFGDPLLSYPVGTTKGRPPLFSMITIMASKVAKPFLGEDALGWAMLILPSIYSTLLIFPFYFLTRELFGRTVAIFATCFLPLVPIFISGSHSGVLSAFDHDSFILLMMITTMYFVVRMLKTDGDKALLYSLLSAVSASAILMSWVVGEIVLIIIFVFMFLKLIRDNILNINDEKTPLLFLVMLVAWIISMGNDTMIINIITSNSFFIIAFGLVITIYDFIRKRHQLPFTLTLFLFGAGIISTFVFYLFDVYPIALIGRYLFSDYIYSSKVSMTISEGSVLSTTKTILSTGFIYIMFFAGLMKFIFAMKKRKFQNSDLFLLSVVLIYLYFVTQAGRFLFDIVPFFVILGSYFLVSFMRNISSKSYSKVMKVVFASIILLLVVSPNVYLSSQATENPYQFPTETRWGEACEFLAEQNTDEAILTWWDYGFYITAMAEIPVVADNFQNGIYPSSNFFTAETESEALSTLVVRMLEPVNEYPSFLPQELIDIMENPTKTEIYGQIIQPDYHNFTDEYVQVSQTNAMYHSAISFLVENYSKQEIHTLYEDVCNYTNKRIGYVGIDYHDFIIAPAIFFTADKSVWLFTRNDSYFTGIDAIPTNLVNNTMFYKMFNGQEMDYFEIIYKTDKIKIFRVT